MFGWAVAPAGQCVLIGALLGGLSGSTARAQQTITYTNGENNSSPIALFFPTDPTTLTIATGSAVQSGVISDSAPNFIGSVIKSGAATLTLTGADTYHGTTTINAGTLALGLGGSVTNSSSIDLVKSGTSFDISSGGNQGIGGLSGVTGSTVNLGANTLTVSQPGPAAQSGTSTFAGVLQGSGGFGKANTGTLLLTGANTYTGSTAISGGTLQFGQEASLYGGQSTSWTAANIRVSPGATLALNVGGVGQFTTGDVTKILQNLGSGAGGLANASAIGLDTTNASEGNVTYSGNITDTHSGNSALGLVKLGTGTLSLAGSNTYSGPTTITAGTIQLIGSLGAGSTVNVGSSGTLSGAGTVNGNATLTGNGIINFSNPGRIAGSLTTTGGSWNGTGAVTGPVTVNSGTFALGAGASLTVPGGLNVTGSGSIAGSGPTSTLIGSINYTSSSYDNFGAVITGAGASVTVNSSGGTLVLFGANTYTGPTTITLGSLFVDGSTSAASTATVGPAGILSPGGGGKFGGDVNLNGGQLTMNSATIGGNLAITGGRWVGGNGTVEGQVTVTSGNFLLDSSSSMTALQGITVSGGTISSGNNGCVLQGLLNYTIPTTSSFLAEILGPASVTVDNPSANLTIGFGNFNGPTTVKAGTLTLTDTLGSLTVEVDSGATLNGTGSGTINGNLNVFGGTVGLTGFIGGTVTITGGATFNDAGVSVIGPMNVISGTLTVNSGAVISAYGGLNIMGGTLSAGSDTTSIYGDVNYTSSLSSTYGGSIDGANKTLTMNNSGSTLVLTGHNTYNGPTTITAGTLQLGSGGTTGSLTTSSTITDNGTLAFRRSNTVTQGVDFGASAITGTGGLTQEGSGTLILNAANAYTGGTAILAGTLLANGTSCTGTGAVTVNSSGTLGGNGTIKPSGVKSGIAIKFASGATLNQSVVSGDFGISKLTFDLRNTGTVTTVDLIKGVKFAFDLGASGVSDQVDVTSGTLTLNGQNFSDFAFTTLSGFAGVGTYDLFTTDAGGDIVGSLGTATGTINGLSATLNLVNSQNLVLTIAAAPEPSSWVLGIPGVLVFWRLHRRRLVLDPPDAD